MIKVLTIIGARPQFVKAAAVSRAIRTYFADQIEEVLLHTGQHYDPNMSEIFFTELEIPKENYNLKIGSGSHGSQTGSIMIALEEVVLKEKPDAILVYGDTNSTLAASIVAIKLHIPIIHVEGGVRFYKKSYPEEVNRIICDHVSSMIFVPSDAGMEALEFEGFGRMQNESVLSPDYPKIFRCGDVMYDNTLYFKGKLKEKKIELFEKYNLPKDNYVLTTMHRPSNVDQLETLEPILKGLNYIVEHHDKSIILPLHPRTKHVIEQYPELKSLLDNKRLHIIPAVSFLDMIVLEEYADLIITDSGGVQKEAYFMETPCLIMLDETPWVELVETGNAVLVGSDYDKICNGANHFLNLTTLLNYPKLYGDGKASEFICSQIIKYDKKYV